MEKNIVVKMSEIDFSDSRYESRFETKVRDTSPQIESLIQAYESGADIPAPVVCKDEKRYIIIDGRRRLTALKKMGKDTVMVHPYQSGMAATFFHSYYLNSTHGQFLTVKDRREAAKRWIGLKLSEWTKEDEKPSLGLTQQELAARFKLSQATVSEVVKDLQKNEEVPEDFSLSGTAKGRPRNIKEKSDTEKQCDRFIATVIRLEKLTASDRHVSLLTEILNSVKTDRMIRFRYVIQTLNDKVLPKVISVATHPLVLQELEAGEDSTPEVKEKKVKTAKLQKSVTV